MKLDKDQERVLSDIIDLEKDEEKNIFGYLDEHIIDEEEKLAVIDFLEDSGYIKVDRLAGNPVHVETTSHGREYFIEEIVPGEDASGNGGNIIFLIIGIIIGAILMYFALKYNII